jgi:hypothetical protein
MPAKPKKKAGIRSRIGEIQAIFRLSQLYDVYLTNRIVLTPAQSE